MVASLSSTLFILVVFVILQFRLLIRNFFTRHIHSEVHLQSVAFLVLVDRQFKMHYFLIVLLRGSLINLSFMRIIAVQLALAVNQRLLILVLIFFLTPQAKYLSKMPPHQQTLSLNSPSLTLFSILDLYHR